MPDNRPSLSLASIVHRTLGSMREPLAVFVQEAIKQAVANGVVNESTVNEAIEKLAYGKKITELDTRTILKFMERVWHTVFFYKPGQSGRMYATEVRVAANKWAHPQHRPQTSDADDAGRFVDTARRLLIECEIDLPDEIQALYRATRRDSEPLVETEPEIESEGSSEAGFEDLVQRFTVLDERFADLSRTVAHGNDTLIALLERRGHRTSQPEHPEPSPEACTERQAAMIFRLLVADLKVDTEDDAAVRDALDDQEFDGSRVKAWCQKRYTKAEAIKKIEALMRKASEQDSEPPDLDDEIPF